MSKISTLTYLINYFHPEQQDLEAKSLDSEFEELLMEMDVEGFVPSTRSVKNIIDFACAYDVLETQNAGIVEMNLN